MGVLIFLGIIVLCIGIYYKLNNVYNKEKQDNKILLNMPHNYILENYYINQERLIVNYKNQKNKVIHIFDLETGSLIKIIELLK